MRATVDTDLYATLLGGEAIIQLLEEQRLKPKAKPLTQGGTKVCLCSKGYDRGDSTFGDFIITYNVKLPDHPIGRQKKLIEQMRREG